MQTSANINLKVEAFEEDKDKLLLQSVSSEVVQRDEIEIVQLLLDAGADVNNPDTALGTSACYRRTALQVAFKSGNIKMVQLLLAAGADMNAPATGNRSTALQAIAASGRTRRRQALAHRGNPGN